jgi:hypothetical protein
MLDFMMLQAQDGWSQYPESLLRTGRVLGSEGISQE